MKKMALLLIFLLAAPSALAAPLREFEGGRLHRAERIDILVLQGTYREMGRQYGGLLREKIDRFYRIAIEERFVRRQKIPLARMRQFSAGAFALYPRRLQEILHGMSETSGVALDKLIILESILGLTFLQAEGAEAGHCSAVAAWVDYTGNGPLVL